MNKLCEERFLQLKAKECYCDRCLVVTHALDELAEILHVLTQAAAGGQGYDGIEGQRAPLAALAKLTSDALTWVKHHYPQHLVQSDETGCAT